MAQLNLYLPAALEKRVRAEAKRKRVSISKYVASVLEAQAGGGDGWSPGFFERVVGAWQGDVPEIDTLRFEDRDEL